MPQPPMPHPPSTPDTHATAPGHTPGHIQPRSPRTPALAAALLLSLVALGPGLALSDQPQARPATPAAGSPAGSPAIGSGMPPDAARLTPPTITHDQWADILSPPQGRWPQATKRVEWLPDLAPAFERARREQRPLFVTFRCLPCKACSDFDKDVLEGGPQLSPLLERFVTVRLTTIDQADLRLFPFESMQDLDVSWWGWFLDPDGRVLGVFGGRDTQGDQTRVSVQSLAATLARVLDHFSDPRRPTWDIDGPLPITAGEPLTVRSLPWWDDWTKLPFRGVDENGCLHCHQTAELLRHDDVAAGRFDKQRDFDVWPLPENVGITLDLHDGLLVTAITPGSPADRAGLKPGDRLAGALGRRLFSQTDFRAALHNGPWLAPGTVPIAFTRGDADARTIHTADLALSGHWRDTDLGWRTSVADAPVGAGPGFSWALRLAPAERKKLGLEGRLAVKPWFGPPAVQAKSPAYKAGLRPTHVITAVNGQSPNIEERAFMVYIRQTFNPGDRVTLTVRDGSRTRDISYTLPHPIK